MVNFPASLLPHRSRDLHPNYIRVPLFFPSTSISASINRRPCDYWLATDSDTVSVVVKHAIMSPLRLQCVHIRMETLTSGDLGGDVEGGDIDLCGPQKHS